MSPLATTTVDCRHQRRCRSASREASAFRWRVFVREAANSGGSTPRIVNGADEMGRPPRARQGE